MKHKIINRLHEEKGFISGEKLSEELGLTRTAIWKHVKSLKAEGYEIEAVTKKGYHLVSSPDIINYDEVKYELDTKIIGKKIYHFDKIGSTNQKAKEIAFRDEEGTVVVSEEQTDGRGRLGRTWISPIRKGIYTSVILKPELEPEKAAKLTLLGAAAVYLALKDIGVESSIKWPNDIVINGKKVAGILTEMNCELGIMNYIVLGIGINVNQSEEEIPDDLKDKATSLRIESGKAVDRKSLFGAILNRLDELYIPFKENEDVDRVLEICRDRSSVIGIDVIVVQGHNEREGHALSINHNGELMVQFKTGIEHILSGEVSIRGRNRYI